MPSSSTLIYEETPAGAALLLAYEMHERQRISVVELRAFEKALRDLASKEALDLIKPLKVA